MDDLISRQAAIDQLHQSYNLLDAEQRLEDLPSAESEREKGKWIYSEDEHGTDGYHCDKCGFFAPWDYVHKFINYIEDYNFCPNCGAKMKGGEA